MEIVGVENGKKKAIIIREPGTEDFKLPYHLEHGAGNYTLKEAT